MYSLAMVDNMANDSHGWYPAYIFICRVVPTTQVPTDIHVVIGNAKFSTHPYTNQMFVVVGLILV